MPTIPQINDMQTRLDSDRSTLASTRDYVAEWQRHFGYSNDQITHFTNAANNLVALNEYRDRGIGWAEQDPAGNDRFKQLRASEGQDRAAVSSTLSEVAAFAENSGRPDAGATATYLREESQRFDSIPGQQTQLHEARREHAEAITRNTRQAIPDAPNQIVSIARSGDQSVRNYQDGVLDYDTDQDSDEMMVGKSAVLGEHFGTGTCHEQSSYAFTEANKNLPGEQVTLMNATEAAHGFVVIGPPNFPESAHIDTWPMNAAVTSPETYGIDNIQEGIVVHQAMADGRDLRAEAASELGELPQRAPRVAPITFEQALAITRQREGMADNTHFITSTTGRPQHGHALSAAAFTAHANNGFRIQSADPQAQLASAVHQYQPNAGPGRDTQYGQGSSASHGQPPARGVGMPPQPGNSSGARR
ncbi:hypothetical protein ACFXOY_07800 [Streptomyces niveus]|uniref:hypothetical protein n=1 Tax=Streptomyces niveus TaxID=193462 RepID=UPI003698EE3B